MTTQQDKPKRSTRRVTAPESTEVASESAARSSFDELSDPQTRALRAAARKANDAVVAFEQLVCDLLDANVSPTAIGKQTGLATSAVRNIVQRRDAGKQRVSFTSLNIGGAK